MPPVEGFEPQVDCFIAIIVSNNVKATINHPLPVLCLSKSIRYNNNILLFEFFIRYNLGQYYIFDALGRNSPIT